MISKQFADIYARAGGFDINSRILLIQELSDQL
jgi:hypothetical protein